ncbi:dipeptidase [Salinicoccus kekensis]|uniref:Dipeptidase n=1 Tax=Salinicoccus kekensis TaxID=714307 RepID=A0A285UG61_9STAP|nr:dipeptidase [Salinicoccus kekensis]SOC39261.1 dipeptidase [Salinicoccus kekensis]
MKIIDTHCDALLKLQKDRRNMLGFMDEQKPMRYLDADEIDTNYERLKEGGVKVQFFAIFISPRIPDNEKWQHALEQADVFYNEVLTCENVVHIKDLRDISKLGEHEIGAVLTLEGSDAFGNDLMKLRTLIRLGVLSLGLVWNNANLVADGVGEKRGAGLTNFGREVIELCNEHGILIDVSHLNVPGFDDIIGMADRVFASHSNVREVHDHPRNLTDEQIERIIAGNGMINIVFCPPFIGEGDIVIKDLFPHIDRIISLGGADNIGIGSDFDGIATYVEGLRHSGEYKNLVDALVDEYGEGFTEKITHRNFIDRFGG